MWAGTRTDLVRSATRSRPDVTQVMIGFHDSLLNRFLREGNDVVLELESASVERDGGMALESGTLRIRSATEVLEDGRPVETPSLPFEYGRVLELSWRTQPVLLLVEWQTFSPRTRRYAEYTIAGAESVWIPSVPV